MYYLISFCFFPEPTCEKFWRQNVLQKLNNSCSEHTTSLANSMHLSISFQNPSKSKNYNAKKKTCCRLFAEICASQKKKKSKFIVVNQKLQKKSNNFFFVKYSKHKIEKMNVTCVDESSNLKKNIKNKDDFQHSIRNMFTSVFLVQALVNFFAFSFDLFFLRC